MSTHPFQEAVAQIEKERKPIDHLEAAKALTAVPFAAHTHALIAIAEELRLMNRVPLRAVNNINVSSPAAHREVWQVDSYGVVDRVPSWRQQTAKQAV